MTAFAAKKTTNTPQTLLKSDNVKLQCKTTEGRLRLLADSTTLKIERGEGTKLRVTFETEALSLRADSNTSNVRLNAHGWEDARAIVAGQILDVVSESGQVTLKRRDGRK